MNTTQTLAAQFLTCIRALETWDLVSLRETWRLPADIPLDALADLVARIEHLDRKSAEAVELAIRRSRAYPWVEASGHLADIRDLLLPVWAYRSAQDLALTSDGRALAK